MLCILQGLLTMYVNLLYVVLGLRTLWDVGRYTE